jgi:hypothetical protein
MYLIFLGEAARRLDWLSTEKKGQRSSEAAGIKKAQVVA